MLLEEELLSLVEKVIEEQHFPSGVQLRQAVERVQEELAKSKQLPVTYASECVQLLCKRCKTLACQGSEIYTIDNSYHVVPGNDFKLKYIEKEYPLKQFKTVFPSHKIHCKICDADWGMSCIWPTKGWHFPVLKCSGFLFLINGQFPAQTLKKWSAAPFNFNPMSNIVNQMKQSDKK